MIDSSKFKASKYILDIPCDIGDNRYIILFNTLTHSLVAVSEKIWKKLRNDNLKEIPTEIFDELINLGFLLPEELDEREIARTRINLSKYNPTHMGMFVNMTSRCNLACPYCYQDLRKNSNINLDLTVENWNKIMKLISKKGDILKKISVVFFGGEPMLNYDTLKVAVRDLDSLREIDIETSMSIITNGTLFSKQTGQELAPFINSVQITLDGMRETHDKMRPYPDGRGTFDIILKNILDNIDQYKKRIILRSNINESNIASVKSLLHYLREEYGLHKLLGGVGFEYIFPTQTSIHAGESYKLSQHISKLLIEIYSYAVDLGYPIGNPLVLGPCMASHAFSFAVDEQLNVYKCPGFLYSNPDGYIDEDGNLIIMNSRWYSLINFEPPCAFNCKFGPICYGGCKWMASALKSKISCNIEHLQNYSEFLTLYVKSRYKKLLEGEQ
ncbi:radical SAM protein [Thermococcus henrietii]|uniref:radical SAM protein n=1 Tax=Thermococcus henrietii TaxID=2016361 RepID=UPI000C072689|nr:radical SAM protein [Thermococcus henrietii]